MTEREWFDYLSKLPEKRQKQLRKALVILESDTKIKSEFNYTRIFALKWSLGLS